MSMPAELAGLVHPEPTLSVSIARCADRKHQVGGPYFAAIDHDVVSENWRE